MATITRELLPDKDITLFTIEGSASMEEMLDTVRSIPPEQTTRHVIWDASRGTVATIGTEALRHITRFLKTGHGMRPGGMTALVGPDDMNFGIGRMFQAYAELERLAVRYKTFRTLDAAIAWIESGQDGK